MAKNIDVCNICEQDYDAFINFTTTPFVNGKKYKIVCHCCLCVLKPEVASNIDIIVCPTPQLRSLKEITEDGFDINKAKKSLLAVGKLLGMKNKKIKELM